MAEIGRPALATLHRTGSGHILVDAQTADGDWGRFIVDTAAAKSVLSRSSSLSAKAAAAPETKVEAHGAGGPVGAAGTATLGSLRIGRTTLAPAEFIALDLQPIAAKLGSMVDGVLGLNALLRNGFWLDLRANLLSLSFAEPPERALSFERVSYEMTSDRLIALRVSTGERSILAVLDTGAANTMVNGPGLESLLGWSLDPNALPGASRALGADGASTLVRMASSPGFRIGLVQFPPQRILLAELPVFERFGAPSEAIMLLGLDTLGTRSIGIDAEAGALLLSTE